MDYQSAQDQRSEQRTRATSFQVIGSHGQMTVCVATGDVQKLVPFGQSSDYSAITRFDVTEWRQHWQTEPAGLLLDILDVGYWEGDEFVAPEADWRDGVREVRLMRLRDTGAALPLPTNH